MSMVSAERWRDRQRKRRGRGILLTGAINQQLNVHCPGCGAPASPAWFPLGQHAPSLGVLFCSQTRALSFCSSQAFWVSCTSLLPTCISSAPSVPPILHLATSAQPCRLFSSEMLPLTPFCSHWASAYLRSSTYFWLT